MTAVASPLCASDSPAAKAQIEAGRTNRLGLTRGFSGADGGSSTALDRISRLRPGEKALGVERDGKLRTVDLELSSIPAVPGKTAAATISKQKNLLRPMARKPKTVAYCAGSSTHAGSGSISRCAGRLVSGSDLEPVVWTLTRRPASMEATIFTAGSPSANVAAFCCWLQSRSPVNRTENLYLSACNDVVKDSATYNVAADRIAIHGFDDGGVFAATVVPEYRNWLPESSRLVPTGVQSTAGKPPRLPPATAAGLGAKDPITRPSWI